MGNALWGTGGQASREAIPTALMERGTWANTATFGTPEGATSDDYKVISSLLSVHSA